jgi:hypothetical protein
VFTGNQDRDLYLYLYLNPRTGSPPPTARKWTLLHANSHVENFIF